MFKKIITMLAMVVVGLVFFAAEPGPAVQTSSAVQIPLAVQVALGGFLFATFTAAFVYINEKTGLNLGEYALPLSGTVSIFLVGVVQGWINVLPTNYDPLIQIAINVVVVILAGVGALRILAARAATLLNGVGRS